MGDEATVLRELIGFLSPTTRLDVRRAALEYIVGLSGALDGSSGKLFMDNDFAMGKAVCHLCEATVSDRSPTLAALTNFCSGSAEAADFVLGRTKITQIAFDGFRMAAPFSGYAARLLANLSRHFPDKVDHLLSQHNDQYFRFLLDDLTTSPDESLAFIGYTLVNVSTLTKLRSSIAQSENLSKICSLLSAPSAQLREIGADVLRNLSFEEGLHDQLLNSSDEYLTSVLSPLADTNDDLSDEEIQKLPIRLQYFERKREETPHVRQKLIEALYQLCATRQGRETLRKKGVYALLRELDRATTEEADPHAPPPKMRPPQLLAQEEHTLHALIGVLIRYEEEMGIHPSVDSLKQLE